MTPPTAAALVPPPPATPPPSDPVKRAAYFLARAKAGDPMAQHNVAVLYAEGNGLAQDYASAAAWFREAAINGVVNAQYNLAVLYERGLGVPRNMSEALIWYHSAADRNHPAAQYNLGLAYAEGRGTPQDFVQAAGWYHRAAEQGVAPAMVNFAILYERGQGVEKSPVDAYAWYRAAAQRGDAEADKRSSELLQQFSAADKTRAQTLAMVVAQSIHPPSTDGGQAVRATPVPSPASVRNSGPPPVLAPGLGRRSDAGRPSTTTVGPPGATALDVAAGVAGPAEIDTRSPQIDTVIQTPRAISEVQRRLARAQFSGGTVDGVLGRDTIQAIRRYQETQGLPVDGTATVALLNYLRSTATPASPASRRTP